MSFLIVLSLLAIIWFLLDKYLLNYWKRHGFQQLKTTFFVGNCGRVITKKTSFFGLFDEFYCKSKELKFIGFYNFYKPSILVNDPKMIYDVLIRDFSYFHDHAIDFDVEMDPLSGHLFSLTGQKWRDLRVKLSPAFTSGKLRMMFPVMKQCSEVLVDFMDKRMKNNQNIFVINEMFKRYSCNVISSVAFGIDNDCISEPNNDFYKYGNRFFDPDFFRVFLFIFMPNLMSVFKIKFAPNDVDAFFKKLIREIVDYREENNYKRNDFMDLLLQLKNQGYVSADKDSFDDNEDDDVKFKAFNTDMGPNSLQKLTFEELAAQAFVFFLAAFETSSAAIAFCIFELAKNQEIQKKVQDEIDQALSGDVTYESLQKLKYTECCLMEGLRKYPPVPVLNRICTKDYKIRDTNLVIKKGTDIKIPIMSLHRDPEIFDNPMEFRPERFLDSPNGNSSMDTENGVIFYSPFGDGPRHCIGMRFARFNAKLIFAKMLSKYKFSLVDEELHYKELKLHDRSFALRPEEEIEIRAEKR